MRAYDSDRDAEISIPEALGRLMKGKSKLNPEWLRVAEPCTVWNGLQTLRHVYRWLLDIEAVVHSDDFASVQSHMIDPTGTGATREQADWDVDHARETLQKFRQEMKQDPEEPHDEETRAKQQEELTALKQRVKWLKQQNETVSAAFENYTLPLDGPLFRRLKKLQEARQFYIPGILRSARQCGRRLWDTSRGLLGEPPLAED